MKRFAGLVIGLLLIAFAAAPASAQGPSSREDHVCFGGNTVVQSSERPLNVVLFGCGGRIRSGVQVGRDVVSFGGNVVIEEGAQVGRDVVIFGGNLDLSGQVGRQVVVFGGNANLQPGSRVADDVQAFGGNVNQQQGATVGGRIIYGGNVRIFPFTFFVPTIRGGVDLGVGLIVGVLRGLITALAIAALGALVLVFLPAQTDQVSQTAQQAALPSVGVGCLTLFVAPFLLLLLIVTCLGIPVAGILGVALVAAILFGWIAVSIILGEKVLTALNAKNIVPMLSLVVGVLILWLVTSLLWVFGWLVSLFVASLALGAVVLTRFGTRPYPPVATVPAVGIPPAPPAAPPPAMPPAPPAPPIPPGSSSPSD
jgi:hypothetical protein